MRTFRRLYSLRRLRETREMSQVDLARLVNRSEAFISQLESGVRGASAETLVLLAQALRTSIDELLAEAPPEPTTTRAASRR